MRKVSDADILAHQRAGRTATESATMLGVTDGAVRYRAKKLGVKFVKRPGTPSRALECKDCPDRKLCVMCHKLRVCAIPCEGLLPGAAEDKVPATWPKRYAILRKGEW